MGTKSTWVVVGLLEDIFLLPGTAADC